MTLTEARAHIGSGVVYRPHPDALAEEGEITGCSGAFVFVRFVGDRHPKACVPEDLTLLSGGA
jgi:hypothetical protein